ncbi:MAG: hypothetical protein ACFFA1_07020 [Promethearchaeota archaeon]
MSRKEGEIRTSDARKSVIAILSTGRKKLEKSLIFRIARNVKESLFLPLAELVVIFLVFLFFARPFYSIFFAESLNVSIAILISLFCSFFIVLPLNNILSFLGSNKEKKIFKEQGLIQEVKRLAELEIRELESLLVAEGEILTHFNSKLLWSHLEVNENHIVYGPRGSEYLLKKNGETFRISDEVFNDGNWGRFLVVHSGTSLPSGLSHFELLVKPPFVEKNVKVKDSQDTDFVRFLPQARGYMRKLIRLTNSLSNINRARLRLTSEGAELIIEDYKPFEDEKEYGIILDTLTDLDNLLKNISYVPSRFEPQLGQKRTSFISILTPQ